MHGLTIRMISDLVGTHHLRGWCHACGRRRDLDPAAIVQAYGDVVIAELGARMRCSGCKARGRVRIQIAPFDTGWE